MSPFKTSPFIPFEILLRKVMLAKTRNSGGQTSVALQFWLITIYQYETGQQGGSPTPTCFPTREKNVENEQNDQLSALWLVPGSPSTLKNARRQAKFWSVITGLCAPTWFLSLSLFTILYPVDLPQNPSGVPFYKLCDHIFSVRGFQGSGD
ncbi:hypothetical protein QQP08_000227 [Theobroma cacao]|nr:hypothetical protein QQP08_000227 [Theobroma cacao]